jgi:hypothetical protein
MLASVSAAATMIATEIPISAPDGRCTATGREAGCVRAGAGDGVLPDPSQGRVREGDGLGVCAGAGRLSWWGGREPSGSAANFVILDAV